MNTSIIVLSYNTKALTKKCIKSIIASLSDSVDIDAEKKTEIIVLDNASTDGSQKMLQELETTIPVHIGYQVIESKENLGFTKGNNKAFEYASGTNLLFLNSDIEVVDMALPNFISWFNENHHSIAGARLVYPNGSIQASSGRFYTPLVAFFALFLKGDHWGASRFSPRSIMTVDWVSGACLMIKKDLFDRLSGFDEKIFMYWEEIDLLYRARKLSYKTWFYPKATFIHHEGKSSSSRQQPILRVYEGYIYFYEKHYSRLQLNILRYMLKLKAIVSIQIGRLSNNRYLIDTYTKAYEMVKMAR